MSRRKKHLDRALLDAVLSGDLSAARGVLAGGADVNTRDAEHQETPLMLARSEAAARLLLEHGADIHARDDRGATAFLLTRRPLLVRAGADMNAQDDEGRTALMRAVEAADTDAVRQLLALGVDLNLRDREGESALSRADSLGLLAIAECLLLVFETNQ